MQQFHELTHLERAARSAVGCWFKIEQGLCNTIQGTTRPDDLLTREWFAYWQVARTFRKDGDREGILALLFEKLPRLKAASPSTQSWEIVERLSIKIKPMNCGTRPTSLVSKFAFSCCPTTFVPYDRIVRGQLRTLDHDYVAYKQAFSKTQADIERKLKKFIRPSGEVGLTSQNLAVDGRSMDQRVFLARITDWYLLLQGRYDPIGAGNPVHFGPMT